MDVNVAELTSQLVRIPSVNPMGRSVAGPEYLEGRVAVFLVERFRQWGLAWERYEVMPGRDNLLVGVPGDPAAGLVLLDAHLDTVPVDGMTIAPFGGEIRAGRIYGRGACDVKGGLAAMLTTLVKLSALPPEGRPQVVLACTVNEEFGFTGAQHVANLWQTGKSKLLSRQPDRAIVAEPTLLKVVVAHKGVVRWRIHTLGKAVHSSRPELGVNAIYAMGRVTMALEEYARDVLARERGHALVGPPTLSVGTIVGGISVNTVPDRCTIEIDRRLVPGDDPALARQAIIDHLASRVGGSVQLVHDEPFVSSPGLAGEANKPLAATLCAAVRRKGRASETIAVPYGTNAAAYAPAVPAVVFGPGSIDQAHTADEWIAVEQLEAAVEVLTALLSG